MDVDIIYFRLIPSTIELTLRYTYCLAYYNDFSAIDNNVSSMNAIEFNNIRALIHFISPHLNKTVSIVKFSIISSILNSKFCNLFIFIVYL